MYLVGAVDAVVVVVVVAVSKYNLFRDEKIVDMCP